MAGREPFRFLVAPLPSTLKESDTYPGAQFRRLRSKLGAAVTIKAMAAKLARLVYRMLRWGMPYVDRGAELYEDQHRQRQILKKSVSGGAHNNRIIGIEGGTGRVSF